MLGKSKDCRPHEFRGTGKILEQRLLRQGGRCGHRSRDSESNVLLTTIQRFVCKVFSYRSPVVATWFPQGFEWPGVQIKYDTHKAYQSLHKRNFSPLQPRGTLHEGFD